MACADDLTATKLLLTDLNTLIIAQAAVAVAATAKQSSALQKLNAGNPGSDSAINALSANSTGAGSAMSTIVAASAAAVLAIPP